MTDFRPSPTSRLSPPEWHLKPQAARWPLEVVSLRVTPAEKIHLYGCVAGKRWLR